MTFVSYAQNCEDVLLWRALGGVERGFYIDVGAQHPDIDSVTRAFYDRGWSGVNIEPLVEEAARLRAARPRDVTLQLALGATSGTAPFFAVEGTGLSTLDAAVAREAAGSHPVRETTIAVRTLAEICRLHAAPEIHFLKIDVEGAEQAVLEGADLVAFRPWIVLAEATAPLSTRQNHAGWEPLLLAADYVFVWFDGLNRYYVSRERLEQLAPAFRIQPNVFDDFLRAGDSGWIRRLGVAETELDTLRTALGSAQAGLRDGAQRAERLTERASHEIARLREGVADARRDAADAASGHEHALREMRQALHDARHELQQTHLRLQSSENTLHDSRHELQQTHLRLQAAGRDLAELQASRSWRLTAPLRRTVFRLRGPGGAVPPDEDERHPAPDPAAAKQTEPALVPSDAVPMTPATEAGVVDEARPVPDATDPPAALPPLPILPPPSVAAGIRPDGLVAVHQFHSGSAVGDAITNAMLLTRGLLRSMGYDSEIYTEEPPAALAHELRPMEQLPRHDGYVLIVRHSMGYDRFGQILDLPARKILLYHNITPPELLARHPYLAHYARLGRTQLEAFRGRVEAALADSEYNAIELRRLRIAPVRACTLLFDVDALRRRAADAVGRAALLREDGLLTLLFVGRINEAKGQLELVEAFAAFRAGYPAASRLVLVGRDDGSDDHYAVLLRARIAALGLEPHVVLTGPVPDDALDAWYGAADLYVSLSRHEGFGVPLIEAMAHGVPVLAWPGGAVPYTLAGAGRLLDSTEAGPVAAALLALALDGDARASQRARQAVRLDRFALDRQRTVLAEALLRAGAALPADPATAPLLHDNLRYSVTGHVNGSYSLAAINRDLALRLEAARPGRVRLLPVEGGPTLDLSGVPEEQAGAISELAHRPPHPTGPELVISQHYPVHVPPRPGDVPVAMLFWEESLLPAAMVAVLEASFRAVVAPTGFVRDVLIQSGLRIPVRVIPPAVRLDGFAALRETRAARPAGAAHRFLHVSSCFPRKGVDVLLRAWARAFRAHDPVRLVIKGFPNPHNEVAAMLAALRAADPALAAVELIDRDLDADGLLALYADADTMVLPTRGEGYNLPAAEALAAGLPLIVTGRGGHLDFCAEAGLPLPGVRLLDCRAARSGSHLASPHSLWFEPDEDDLVAALREAVARGPVVPEPPALPGPGALADAYARLATELLLAAPPAPVRLSWVSSWNLRCGVSEYSRQLLDGLGDESGRIRVLCDRRTAAEDADGPEAGRFWPCWQVGDPRTLEPLAAALAADDADAVMLQHQPGLLPFETMAAILDHPALRGRVVLATLHNTRHLLDLPVAAQAAVLLSLGRIDRVLVHTVADLDRLQALGLAANVVLLPHGVAAPLPLRPVRSIEPGSADGPVIGCYGFFLPGKGIDTLIEAFAMLRRAWPEARLLLVNAEYDAQVSRDEIARSRALVASLGLADAVTFETGFLAHHQSLELLAGCDLLALPYAPSKEASSAALRGTLTAGVPVAVTPIDLFAEADAAVFRFDGIDAAAVAAGLDRLLRDPALRAALQDAARGWIAARQWPDVARRLDGLVTGLVHTRALDRGTRAGA